MDAMGSDPDETVRDLRTELFESLDDLHKKTFRGVDEFARFLETTRDDETHAQIPKLWRQRDSMQLLKTRLIDKLKTSSFAPSPMGQKGQNECLHKETYPVHRPRLNRRPLNRKRGSPTKLA